MSDMLLKIPNGHHCDGCMFLDLDFMHNYAACNLFGNSRLRYKMEYGEITDIQKAPECPTGDF